jgi:hypothetical protein
MVVLRNIGFINFIVEKCCPRMTNSFIYKKSLSKTGTVD